MDTNTQLTDCELPENFLENDLLSLRATDPNGKEIFDWIWTIKSPADITRKLMKRSSQDENCVGYEVLNDKISTLEGGLSFTFGKKDGTLLSVANKNGNISFNGGPVSVGRDNSIEEVGWRREPDGSLIITGKYYDFPSYFRWELSGGGILYLEVGRPGISIDDIKYLGVSFNYPG